MRQSSTILAAALLCCASGASAQLGLPGGIAQGLPGALPNLPGTDVVPREIGSALSLPPSLVPEALRQARLDRIDTLLRTNRDTIERDFEGAPARRGVLFLLDSDPKIEGEVVALGFVVDPASEIEGLDLKVNRVGLPNGMSVSDAQKLLRKKVPQAQVSSDQIFFQSGGSGAALGGAAPAGGSIVELPIGIIDGAPAQPVTAVRGFAKGAPQSSNHGSAVSALAYAAGARKIYVADVYGSDPAGGNALAIAQGMGWLVTRGAKVISLSLVGPRSPLLERAVSSAQARGVVIVAAVGNDGPAAPPSYPASYEGVLAVTAVDKRNRPLIEAGRATHLDYAAPGADMSALDCRGKLVPVRGTSFAAPLVAVRAAAALERGNSVRSVVAVLDAEALQIAKRRPDPQSGRGLLCAGCR
ncbi:MAG: S8 family serine peptidase [Novosphingobium sp.]